MRNRRDKTHSGRDAAWVTFYLPWASTVSCLSFAVVFCFPLLTTTEKSQDLLTVTDLFIFPLENPLSSLNFCFITLASDSLNLSITSHSEPHKQNRIACFVLSLEKARRKLRPGLILEQSVSALYSNVLWPRPPRNLTSQTLTPHPWGCGFPERVVVNSGRVPEIMRSCRQLGHLNFTITTSLKVK